MKENLSIKILLFIFLIGLIGNFIPFSLISWSEQYIQSNTAGLLLSVAPIFTLFLSYFFIKEDKFFLRNLISIFIGLLTVSFVGCDITDPPYNISPLDCAGIPGGDNICGCTDNTACNYVSTAIIDNGSCSGLVGCMDGQSSNYNALATCDDGSCIPYMGMYAFGGVVFYILQQGDIGYVSGETHGLICDIYGFGNAQIGWGC